MLEGHGRRKGLVCFQWALLSRLLVASRASSLGGTHLVRFTGPSWFPSESLRHPGRWLPSEFCQHPSGGFPTFQRSLHNLSATLQ